MQRWGLRDDSGDLWLDPEQADRQPNVRVCSRTTQEPSPSFTPQGLTDGLEGWPLLAIWHGGRQANPGQALGGGQVGEVWQINSVVPQVPRHLLHRAHGKLGQRPVPLRPSGLGRVGEVEALDHLASLPMAVAGHGGAVERVAASWHMSHPDAGGPSRVGVKGHLAQPNVGVSSSDMTLATSR
jgi:hypothetical protein